MLYRLPCLRTEACAVQIHHARDESYNDGGRNCVVEEEGGRKVRYWRRLARDRTCHALPRSVLTDLVVQETDKATIDVEAVEDGILAKIIASTSAL